MMFGSDVRAVERYDDGVVILGEFGSTGVADLLSQEPFELCVMDPPYVNIVKEKWDAVSVDRFLKFMLEQLGWLAAHMPQNSPAYVFGGVGTYRSRLFFRLMSELEFSTPWHIANMITWGKKRAYGKPYDYQFTREELAYLTLGEPRSVRRFNVPYLCQKRGYDGYNKKYPAKSEYLRRTNVWTDVTEIFRGKLHVAQKPVDLIKIPILASSDHGQTVLDPFAGSGTTALAARATGRRFVLVESDEASFEIIRKRLRNE